MNMMSKYQTL